MPSGDRNFSCREKRVSQDCHPLPRIPLFPLQWILLFLFLKATFVLPPACLASGCHPLTVLISRSPTSSLSCQLPLFPWFFVFSFEKGSGLAHLKTTSHKPDDRLWFLPMSFFSSIDRISLMSLLMLCPFPVTFVPQPTKSWLHITSPQNPFLVVHQRLTLCPNRLIPFSFHSMQTLSSSF